MEIPRHSGSEDQEPVHSTPRKRTPLLLVFGAAGVMILIVVLHATGVIHGH
jgi:hypothetical protein